MKLGNIFSVFSAGSANILGDAGMVIVIGLVVVFLTLIALTFIFWIFGRMMSRGKNNTYVQSHSELEPFQMQSVKAAPAAYVPENQDGISDEVIAVIAAAVAAMTPDGSKYTIRSVRRVRSERSVWAAAGLAENTRPF